jgi:CBS domain-containing protein
VSPSGLGDRGPIPASPAQWDAMDVSRAMLTIYSPVSRIMRRDPFAVPLEATIRETLERMERTRTGVVVVVEPHRRIPLGIFTLEDVIRRVTLPDADLGEPIASVMTSGLITVVPQSSAHEAILTMARHGVQHLVVVDAEGALAGLVSQEQVFGLQRMGVDEVGDRIQAAADLDGLRAAALSIRRLTEALLAQAIHAETLTHFISTLNDLLTIRVIELTMDGFDLPPVPFCWIALGSEGRLEQTFSTDQDNGIVLDADDADAEVLRRGFLPFARAVNEALAACGFPLCKGNVMASNPQWCLTLGEWERAFSRWIDTPEPEAILNAEIFFDLRPVYGRTALAQRLWDWLLPAARRRPLFLTLMAQNALACRPPLGRIRDFVVGGSKAFPHTLDLKAHGSRIFVDAARVLALEHGIPHTSTAERLRAAAAAGALDPGGVAAIVDGFHFVHQLRLRNQFRRDAPSSEGANRLDPRRLNPLDRIVLKEAFRQARRLQERLALDYRIDALG